MKTMMALCALVVAGPAIANENPFAKDSVVLRYDDLNLDTATGRQRLDQRLANAAAAVCGAGLARIHLSMDARSRACRSEVVASYRAQIAARRDKGVRVAGL